MKIEHVRVGGIYKLIADAYEDIEDDEVCIPKGHLVRVINICDNFVHRVQIEDITDPMIESVCEILAENLSPVAYADLYGQDYQAEETKQNKDSPTYNQHYANMIGLQPIEVMQDVLSSDEFRGFLKGNIIKYTMRAGRKQGESAEKDIAKAKQYQRWLNDAKGYIPIDPRK